MGAIRGGERSPIPLPSVYRGRAPQQQHLPPNLPCITPQHSGCERKSEQIITRESFIPLRLHWQISNLAPLQKLTGYLHSKESSDNVAV
ncbi:Hypothetical predicted protein [Cloeon dipterum]|uniref:Uncharacterized protein n=1 Tax=Cloeon dipterum TaxID=197152 RepID=A0A8S1D931_9INSE|nr:Hypothetical predicted protein [Cloeon dipterum]